MQTFIAIIFFQQLVIFVFFLLFFFFWGGVVFCYCWVFFLVNTVSSIEVKFPLKDNMSLKILKAIMFDVIDVSLYKHCVKI